MRNLPHKNGTICIFKSKPPSSNQEHDGVQCTVVGMSTPDKDTDDPLYIVNFQGHPDCCGHRARHSELTPKQV